MSTKKDRTRDTILTVAYGLFAKEGFTKLTMKDICEACSMSRGGLYSHFGSTCEVFEAILERISKKSEMNFRDEMQKGISAVEILDSALLKMREEMAHPEDSLSLAIYEYACSLPNDTMNHFHRTGELKWKELIEYGISRNEFNRVEVDELVNIILFAYQGVRMWSRIVDMSSYEIDAIVNHIRKQLVKKQ